MLKLASSDKTKNSAVKWSAFLNFIFYGKIQEYPGGNTNSVGYIELDIDKYVLENDKSIFIQC